MAMWLFTAAIMEGAPLKLFNNGRLQRDFTYIDDVTEAVVRLIKRPPEPNPRWSGEAPIRRQVTGLGASTCRE